MKYSRETETIEDVQGTISMLEEYLQGAKEAEGKDLGPFAHIYGKEAVEFAKAQLAFERERLSDLTNPNHP